MKSLNRSLVLGLSACALVVIGATSWGSPLSGTAATPMPLIQAPQTPPQPAPDPAQQAPAPDQAQQTPAKSASFTGTVVKNGDQYVLRDSSGQVYKLDDSTRAQQFEGKQVKVTGTLDADSKMIHVDNIESAQG